MSDAKDIAPGWRVATGHQATTDAAAAILADGGNAVDAVIAAAATACVAEPLLASMGGGLLAIVRPGDQPPVALDAFCQTPKARNQGELDFYPIIGHFGTDTQEFHVGLASMATPGAIAGLSELSRRFGRLPLIDALAPAIEAARSGVALNAMQRYTLDILRPIIRSNADSARLFGLDSPSARLPEVGSMLSNGAFGAFLEEWGKSGPDCFYKGEPALDLARECKARGGHLQPLDFSDYRPVWRHPLRWTYRNATLWSAPPPAFGGLMLAMALGRLQQAAIPSNAAASRLLPAMIEALDWTNRTRHRLETPEILASVERLESAFNELMAEHSLVTAGTTHMSIEDADGLGIALTLSNGEGCGIVVPGTGIMMNNMLGEEDINRCGFHAWPPDRRLASMMAPTLIENDRAHWLLGSGGSNRIRSALVQVIVQLIDHDRSLREAILEPRLHVEAGRVSAEVPEGCRPECDSAWWKANYPSAMLWPDRNLFFGGVHAVSHTDAAADPRRQGSARRSHVAA